MNPSCMHCDARLSDAELAGGWCETCGKRLPSSATASRQSKAPQEPSVYQATVPAHQPPNSSRRSGGCVVGFVGGFLGGALGLGLGLVLLRGSLGGWGPDIFAGLCAATGSTIAKALHGRSKRIQPPRAESPPITAANGPTAMDEDWQDQAEKAVEGWICGNCDTPVEEAAAACPTCATPRQFGKEKED